MNKDAKRDTVLAVLAILIFVVVAAAACMAGILMFIRSTG